MVYETKNDMKKICCVFNYNPLYRLPIYQAMSKRFGCDFYFGDSVFEPLKQFDPRELEGFVKYLHVSRLCKGYKWMSGITPLFSRKYTHYIITGDLSYVINWLILIYAFLTRRKVYCWCHGTKSYISKWYARKECQLFYNSMDGVFLYNNYAGQFMKQNGVHCPMYVIHNSLNTPIQTDLYNQLVPSDIYTSHFGNNNPVALFIGRIQKRMKVQYLIEAAELLRKRGTNINLVIVGAYMDGVDVEQMVRDKKMQSQVWFYGPSFDELNNSKLLYNADVCVAPGTVGLTAIHSLSYGTPCITHDNHSATGPEFEAIIPGKTGDFFTENDVENLAEIMKKWLCVPKDKREAIRRDCRKEVEDNWSIASQIALLQKIIV